MSWKYFKVGWERRQSWEHLSGEEEEEDGDDKNEEDHLHNI